MYAVVIAVIACFDLHQIPKMFEKKLNIIV